MSVSYTFVDFFTLRNVKQITKQIIPITSNITPMLTHTGMIQLDNSTVLMLLVLMVDLSGNIIGVV